MPRMVLIAAIRQAEEWSALNVIGGVALLVVVVALLVVVVRRYLS